MDVTLARSFQILASPSTKCELLPFLTGRLFLARAGSARAGRQGSRLQPCPPHGRHPVGLGTCSLDCKTS